MKASRITKCPTCRRLGEWVEGEFAPFCSHRCRLIDLGKWLGEENLISGPLRPEHFQGFEDLPPGEELDRPAEN